MSALLEDLVADLRSRFGDALEVLVQAEDHVALRVGSKEDAVLGVRVADPGRPSFTVSHPELKVKKDGSRHVEVVEYAGVLIEGIRWIVKELEQHGCVTPEFF